VAQDDGRAQAVAEAANRPVVELSDYVAPHAPFPRDGSNQPVRATGHYEGDRQVLVAGRRLAGADGFWVLTPLVVDATGARIPVLRGFVRSPQAVRPPVSGTVTVTGTLAPGESPAPAKATYPAGQVGSVDLTVFVNVWPGEVYNAFVFAQAQNPADPAVGPAGVSASGGMEPVPPPEVPTGLVWRNAAYAVQWWIFAAFVLVMWWKMVRDAANRRLDPASAGSPEPPVSSAGAPQ
jgi:cytochrome oxidase assembly protein ShyY1